MSFQDLTKYFNAVKQLNSGTRPTFWDNLTRRHTYYYSKIHSDPIFIPWHRIFLWELEVGLRKIDPSIRIPYWDWTVHYKDMSKDPIWQWFGKEGNYYWGNCVTTGQFANFQVYYYADPRYRGQPHCFTRMSYIANVFSTDRDYIDSNIIDSPNNDVFADRFEYGPHARVHNGLGLDFSDHASSNDPLFFSHHAFVDKVWYDRQMRHPESAYDWPLDNTTPLPGYVATINDTFDVSKLCYGYLEDNFSRSKDATIYNRMSLPEIQPEPYVPLQSNNGQPVSDEAEDSHAKDYILKDVVAPSTINASTSSLKCDLEPITEPMSSAYIRKMMYKPEKVRTIERQNALFISDKNKKCLNE
jgi:hypothetical protein